MTTMDRSQGDTPPSSVTPLGTHEVLKPTTETDAQGNTKPTLAVVGPVNIRNLALLVLLLLASVVMLSWARTILVPIAAALLIAYALDPLVLWQQRFLKIPRIIGATLVLTLILGSVAYASYLFQFRATDFLDRLPQAVRNATRSLRLNHPYAEPGMIEKVKETAEEIEAATEEAGGGDDTPPDVTKVQIEEPAFELSSLVWHNYEGALTSAGQAFTVAVLVFLFLICGPAYKRKLVRIAGPPFRRRRMMLLILNDLNRQIKRYLFVLLISAIFVGVFTWLAFWWVGLEQALLWGIVAGIASAIPYVGPAVVFVATGLVGLLQFQDLAAAFGVAMLSLVVTGIQGWLLTPWLTSQASSINALTVFLGLLFWGWIWGPVGLLVGTPLMIMLRVCCDHISNLRGLGQLLGDENTH